MTTVEWWTWSFEKTIREGEKNTVSETRARENTKKETDVKIPMNKKVAEREEKRKESSRFNLQQNLGQKENLPLSTVDPEDYGMVMWTFWNLSGGTG